MATRHQDPEKLSTEDSEAIAARASDSAVAESGSVAHPVAVADVQTDGLVSLSFIILIQRTHLGTTGRNHGQLTTANGDAAC